MGGLSGFQMPVGDEERHVRSFIKDKIREIVRKKKGGGGYILYSPNRGKKKRSKPVGEFPTRAAAKQAELNRFPPRDPEKMKKAKKAVDSMRRRKRKNESTLAHLYEVLLEAAGDALDKELDMPDVEDDGAETDTAAPPSASGAKELPAGPEPTEPEEPAPPPPPTEAQPPETDASKWEQLLSSLSKDALKRDSRLRSLHQKIENQSAKALDRAVKALSRDVSYKVAKGKSGSDRMGRRYVTCMIETDSGDVGPIYLYVKGELLNVVSDGNVKSDIMKLEPSDAEEIKRALRELPGSFENEKIKESIEQRDAYLADIESELDDYLSDLDALEMTMIKKLIADKYVGDGGGQ